MTAGKQERIVRAAASATVTGTRRVQALELGEVVCAPGVEDASLLDAVFLAGLAAVGAQSPELAQRYRSSLAGAGGLGRDGFPPTKFTQSDCRGAQCRSKSAARRFARSSRSPR
jgi:hypothetical protein